MQQEIGEFYETVNDALRATVQALGGFKKVGPLLRPEKTIEEAANWLRDCLNPERREKLSPEQVLFILRQAGHAGFHSLMNFLAFDAGYKAMPIDPQTQEAMLQERFIGAVEALGAIQSQIQRVQRMRAVA